ncbi:MAG: copper resistance CopC family protein [Actinomycetota bacterium]
MKRSLVRVVPVAAALIVLALPAPALAHPRVVSTTPADGSTVSQPPGEVSVEFDELVEGGSLEVYDPCGARVDSGSPQTVGSKVTVGIFADRAGRYTAVWEVIGEDGHPVRGDWTFTSSGGAACAGSGGGSEGTGKAGGSGGDGVAGSGEGGAGGATAGTDTASGDGSGGAASDDKSGKDADQKRRGKHGRHGKSGGHGNHHDSGEQSRRVNLAADEPSGGDGELPLDWLLISFLIAALIGAAGGAVYASIVGPR